MDCEKYAGSKPNEANDSGDCPIKAKKRRAGSLLGKYLTKEGFKERFSNAFRGNKYFKENDAIIHDKPFKCCVLPNFIENESYLLELKEELMKLDFNQKSVDLYKFQQSNDLKTSPSSNITLLRDLIYQDFRKWLQETCDMKLTDQVDLSCAKYEYTDVLLCHDDELEGRVVAFILYLVPPGWQECDGGSLDLFDVDEHGQPDKIVKKLVPEWNSLSFFEVSPVSFHQVAEVLSQDKTRLSISGWFHGSAPERPMPYKEPCNPTISPMPLEDEHLVKWVNPLYLDQGVVTEIRGRFEDESEVELQDFLLDDKYTEVLEALRSEKTTWSHRGPANKRCYETADSLPEVLCELQKLLKSLPMFKLLRTFTGLDLADTPLTSNERSPTQATQDGTGAGTSSPGNPRCRGEARRWSHGSYTLVHDTDPERAEFALDIMLYCGCEDWDSDKFGGYTSYLVSGEDEELLSVSPFANSLALVYRDMETLKFVKHVNHKSVKGASGSSQSFYDFHMVYYE
ncbi:prolyl 3-hydroxylase OGFOD1 isoform X1 [Nematostella vectensis]|uniref:prolyl 3-hydroxylase OGFOD1 isoform X1 n=1 Tax=Nematostella vectensis TaxID=45351 RepID=UPI0020774C6E|nr:prolyl 3-hydroxylase OGFOD1 isoform X1 [Nematostella vectensis]